MKSEYNLKAKQIALSRDMDKILLMYKGWKNDEKFRLQTSSGDCLFVWRTIKINKRQVCSMQPAILHIKITIKY